MTKLRVCEKDCVFCLSECPACGSMNVDVRFSYHWEYSNQTMNELDINATHFSATMRCNDCGKEMEVDDLASKLDRHFNLPFQVKITINDKGRTHTEKYEV